MQRLKFLALAAILVLVAGASFSGQAQKKMARQTMPPVSVGPLSGTYLSSVDITEISGGEQNASSNETYGWTSNGATTGDLSGFIFLSVNYTSPAIDPVAVVGTRIPPPPDTTITGGSWSRLIFVDGEYQGSVSGRILGGTTTWNQKTQTTAIQLNLAADNGTAAFIDCVGTGTFEGTMDRSGDSPAISGTLTLNY